MFGEVKASLHVPHPGILAKSLTDTMPMAFAVRFEDARAIPAMARSSMLRFRVLLMPFPMSPAA